MDEDLYDAIQQDNRGKLRAILRDGGDPNAWLEDVVRISGKSLLHMCCEKGRYRCAQVLLEYGAEVDIQGSWGQTPLMLCIMTEYFDIAELLINYSKEIVNQQDTYGNTPLHIAIGNDSVEGVQILLRHKPDVNSMNSNGVTPLMKICGTKDSENMPEIVTLLMEAGAQVDIKGFKSRRTALQLAVISKNAQTVQKLLDAGVDPNTIDSGGRTPLTNIIWEHLRNYPATKVIPDDVMVIICMLVQYGADLNINSHEYSNALVMALYFKCAPLVRFLMLNGATQSGSFFHGITPLHHAINKKDIDSLKELLKWSCDLYSKAHVIKTHYDIMLDPFEFAIERGYPEFALVIGEVGYKLAQIKYLTDWSVDPPSCLKDRPDILEALRMLATQPMSLFFIAVLCVRKTLGDDTERKAGELPLPKLLIDNVKLKGILCDG